MSHETKPSSTVVDARERELHDRRQSRLRRTLQAVSRSPGETHGGSPEERERGRLLEKIVRRRRHRELSRGR